MAARWVTALLVSLALAACDGAATSVPSVSPANSAPAIAPPIGDPPAGPPIDLAELRGEVVFSNDVRDVWSMRADGTRLRRVTSSPAWEFDPSWSPDRRRITYRHQTDGEETAEIYVMDADGSSPINLTRNKVSDWGPTWSPNGDLIAFNSSLGMGGFGLRGYLVRPDGKGMHRIRAGDQFVEYPDWSPDGSQIAFMSMEPGAFGSNPDYNIFVMNADGTGLMRLTDAEGSDGWPAWSPDGSSIVFTSTQDDCSISDAPDCRTTGDEGPWHDVWMIDADGSDLRRITPEFGQFFTWAPDGSSIMVSGASGLYVIRPDGTGMTPIPTKGVHPVMPDWTA